MDHRVSLRVGMIAALAVCLILSVYVVSYPIFLRLRYLEGSGSHVR